jgi:hypothetical protein
LSVAKDPISEEYTHEQCHCERNEESFINMRHKYLFYNHTANRSFFRQNDDLLTQNKTFYCKILVLSTLSQASFGLIIPSLKTKTQSNNLSGYNPRE